MPFSTKAFKGLVSHAHREIVSAKYKIQNTYYEATINSIEEKESELVLHLQLNPSISQEVTVSEIALYGGKLVWDYCIKQQNGSIT